MRVRVIPVLIGLALVGAACTSNGGGQTAQSTQAVTSGDGTSKPPGSTATDKPTETKRNKDAKPYAETVKLAIDDIQDWWAKTMPEVYDKKYTAIPDAKIYAVTPKKPAPACTPAGGEAPYEQYEENAMYCTLGQFVAYDDQKLLPQLYKDYGEYALAMVFAHEWGHAIQDQNGLLDTNLPSFVVENQADCFAGAWTKHALDNKAGGFRATEADLQSALAGMLKFRDRPGTDARAASAHGSGFDRVNGFQTGFEEGAEKCVTFSTDLPTPYSLTFTSQEDLDNKGNLPYGDAVRSATEDLNAYWKSLGDAYGFDFKPVDNTVRFAYDTAPPKCGSKQYTEEEAINTIFFCVDDNYVGWDEGMLQGVGEDIGDMGIGTLLAKQWAVSAQVQSQLPKDVIESKEGVTQQSCFTGAWTRAVLEGDLHNTDESGEPRLTLSPGDIDEAVLAFLNISETPDSKGQTATGSAFDQVKAFRLGFLADNGEVECARITQTDSSNSGGTGKTTTGKGTTTTRPSDKNS